MSLIDQILTLSKVPKSSTSLSFELFQMSTRFTASSSALPSLTTMPRRTTLAPKPTAASTRRCKTPT